MCLPLRLSVIISESHFFNVKHNETYVQVIQQYTAKGFRRGQFQFHCSGWRCQGERTGVFSDICPPCEERRPCENCFAVVVAAS